GFQKRLHLVPGLEDPPAVNPLDRRAFENDVVRQIELQGPGRYAEKRNAASAAQHLERLADGARVAGHLEHHVGAHAVGRGQDFRASSPASTVCTAVPSGSGTAAYATGIAGSIFQMFDSGILTNSAKQPSASTPIMRTFWQMCRWPVRH